MGRRNLRAWFRPIFRWIWTGARTCRNAGRFQFAEWSNRGAQQPGSSSCSIGCKFRFQGNSADVFETLILSTVPPQTPQSHSYRRIPEFTKKKIITQAKISGVHEQTHVNLIQTSRKVAPCRWSRCSCSTNRPGFSPQPRALAVWCENLGGTENTTS